MTAPLTPERLAEVRVRADDAQQALLTGTVGSPPNTEGLSKDDALDLLGSSAADVPDLLDAVERLTERAERAEAALARVEALAEEWERKAGETSSAWSVHGPQNVSVPFAVQQIREAMEGTP